MLKNIFKLKYIKFNTLLNGKLNRKPILLIFLSLNEKKKEGKGDKF